MKSPHFLKSPQFLFGPSACNGDLPAKVLLPFISNSNMPGWEVTVTNVGVAIRYFLIVCLCKYWFLIALGDEQKRGA